MQAPTNKQEFKYGTLYLSANHIGCVDDIPPRALELQKTCDLVVFEENRQARRVLKQAGVTRQWLRYNEHHQEDSLEQIRETLKSGKNVIYMSDQGCPTLADPGKNLLRLAYALKARVKMIPGPSAITAAISACPFDLERFVYQGFLSQKTTQRSQEIIKISKEKMPIIILDTPYRLSNLLSSFKDQGLSKKIFIAFDITGEDEQYCVGSASELCKLNSEKNKRNFVLIIEGQ